MHKVSAFLDGFLEGVIDTAKAVGAVATVLVAGRKLLK